MYQLKEKKWQGTKLPKSESKAQVESTASAAAEDAAMPKANWKTKQRQKETW